MHAVLFAATVRALALCTYVLDLIVAQVAEQ
jgi:hypothetical protein